VCVCCFVLFCFVIIVWFGLVWFASYFVVVLFCCCCFSFACVGCMLVAFVVQTGLTGMDGGDMDGN